MKSPHPFQVFFILLALALAAPASAHKKTDSQWEFSITAAAFEARADWIRQEMDDGQYSGVSPSDRKTVEGDLRRIIHLLKKHDDPSRLSRTDQVRLVNAQERINAILTGSDANRLVCKLEASVGTRMKTKRCLTMQEWATVEAASDRMKQDIRLGGGSMVTGGGGGGGLSSGGDL